MKQKKRLCVAHSSQTGKPCRLSPIRGGTVCHKHGGRAPQVKAKAERIIAERTIRSRFDDLQDPAVVQLERRVKDDERPALALRAAGNILDRRGFKAPEKLDVRGVQAFLDASKVRGMDTEEIVMPRRLLIKAGALTEEDGHD